MDIGRRRALLEAFHTLAIELQETHGFSEEEFIGAIRRTSTDIPAAAFNTELTPFETAARWLSEHGQSETAIAKALARPPSVIKKTLENSMRKHPEALVAADAEYAIPTSIFADKHLSFSEQLCLYLREKYGLSNSAIGRLIGLDPRTVWTVLNRAQKKGGEGR